MMTNTAQIELLVRDLFNPSKPVNAMHKSKYLYILAAATSIPSISPTTDVEVCAMFCVCVNQSITHSPLTQERVHKGKNKAYFEETLKALEEVQSICQSNPFGPDLQAVLPQIVSHLTLVD